MAYFSWGGFGKPKVICSDTGLAGLEHRRLPLGSVGLRELSSVRRLKNLVREDPDTPNEAVHLMVVQRAK